MNSALVSVIIPTANRPQYLPRAVESALAGMKPGEVEVIVVPNGPDESWQKSLSSYCKNLSVRILPIKTPNANLARNHGMRQAKGKYIRFLDDDDFLYKEGVKNQISSIKQAQADICSGNVDLADNSGNIFDEWCQDKTTMDFCASACSHRRMQQVTAHLFRKESIIDVAWDESLPYSQDICWIIDLNKQRDLNWIKVDCKVGCWSRHLGQRISATSSIHYRRKLIAERLSSLYNRLNSESRLTEERKKSIADGLWEQVHEALCFSPFYWWKIGMIAENLQPNSHPSTRFYDNQWIKKMALNPLIYETIFAPKRLSRHLTKKIAYRLNLITHW